MNENDQEQVIELSKGKMVLLILGSCAFVALGAWMLSQDPETIRKQGGPYKDPLFVHGVGVAAVLFFGLCLIMGIRGLFRKKPGLVFNSSGITLHSGDFIPWGEIEGAEIFQVRRQKMLIIKLRNPEAYLERGNPIRRATLRMGYDMTGSPISISSNTLKISFPELLSTFERYHQKFGSA